MNKITNSLLVLAVGGLLYTGAAAAQTTTQSNPPTTAPGAGAGPGVEDPNHPRVNQVNRQEAIGRNRIENGEKKGELTKGQAYGLEKDEARLKAQEQADMAANHGHLTKAERLKLDREQKNINKATYRDKHSNTPHRK